MIESFLPLLVSIITSEEFGHVLEIIFSLLDSVPQLRRDIENDFDIIKRDLESMKAFLEDVEDSKTQNPNINSILIWAKQVRSNAYKVEDLIDEYRILAQSWHAGGLAGGLKKTIHSFSDSKTAQDLATKLQKVKDEIDKTAERRDRYKLPSTPRRNNGPEHGRQLLWPYQGENLFGIEKNKAQLLEWLHGDQQQKRVVSICGMAGLGKTTLVREVYNHPNVRKSFKCCAWISVSQSYNLEDLLRSMLEQLQKNLPSHQQLERNQKVENILSANRYLIVLDDVWKSDDIMGLIRNIPSNNFGSMIIFTTRDRNLANSESKQVLNLQPLDELEARKLFFKHSFIDGRCPLELESSAEEIIKKCRGLPLALVAIARVMFLKGTSVVDWKRTSISLDWELRNNEMLEEMSRLLMLSYNSLPHDLKRCFLYCSLLPEDHLIKINWLVKLLVAEGFIEQQSNKSMEEIAEEYIVQLCNKSMLQVVKKDESGRLRSFRVHDAMREIALHASQGENLCIKASDQRATIEVHCRRVSILEKIDRPFRQNEHVSSLRTLLVLTKDPSCIQKISSSLKLLRVLELRGSQIKIVPDDVFQLHNLRYLGLRETNVNEIPATVENLYNLQTLDLWKTKVTELPREILKLKYLRHLFMEDIDAMKLKYHNAGNILRGEGALSNIWELRYLQSLRTIRADDNLVSNLGYFGNFTQLRSLGITKLDKKHGKSLCNSLSRMDNLLRLSIKANDEHVLMLENFYPPRLLQKLILNGSLKSVPTWFSRLRNLRHLYIFDSQLTQDPVPALEELPNLVVLALDNTYNGIFMRFKSGKFQKLEKLSLSNLRQLYTLTIEEGTMPKLQQLRLDNLKCLNFVEGTGNLTECKISIQACPSIVYSRNRH